MKCTACPFYVNGYLSNRCPLTDRENFKPLLDCRLVNEDGEVNQEEWEKGME